MPRFLSPEWMDAVAELFEDAPEPPAAMKDLVINLTITEGPDGEVQARMAGGQFKAGHADEAPTELIMPFDLARKMFIEQDQSAGMQAFTSGKIQIKGDMSRLMAMQGAGGSGHEQAAFAEKLKQITDDE